MTQTKHPPQETSPKTEEEESMVRAIKTRNATQTEYMIYLNFLKPPKSHEELLAAIAAILDTRIGWSKPERARQLLVNENREDLN